MRLSFELLREIGARLPRLSAWRIARRLVTRANAERDAGNYNSAAILYQEAFKLVPDAPRFHIQAGHMYKESGDFPSAEHHYSKAVQRLPDDPDLAMQLGHFYKMAGRLDKAGAEYRRATLLRPGWAEALTEAAGIASGDALVGHTPADAIDLTRLATELLPVSSISSEGRLREGFDVRRLGATHAWARGGYRRVLRGVEAIRGFVVADAGLSEIVIRLDGEEIRRVPMRAHPLPSGQVKYVFNAWHDFSYVAEGVYQIELATVQAWGIARAHRQSIDILPPLDAADRPFSDTIVGSLPQGADPIAVINARPSMVRDADRSMMAEPTAILVQRVDQLGDLACSVPALQRLRSHYPKARIVGLVTSANMDLARTLGLFDEVIVTTFTADGTSDRRTMSIEAQEELRQTLAPHAFDIAIDLGETSGSRPLLKLSGAKFLYGFKDREFRWLSAGVELNTHDPGNFAEATAHASKLVAMIDAMAGIVGRRGEALHRADLDRDMLAKLGILPTEDYVVLHTGARLAFSRWGGFSALASLLAARTDLKIVVLSDEPAAILRDDGRILSLHGKLDFDVFDALLSFSSLFVGNDSGPKHLAALRGVPVISIHMARLNWNEWGQTGTGSIISRRVPCAGCGIGTNAEDCGQDFACITRITPEEVLDAALTHLSSG